MLPRFEQFIRERQYLTNVSPATLPWYKYSLNWLRCLFLNRFNVGTAYAELCNAEVDSIKIQAVAEFQMPQIQPLPRFVRVLYCVG